MIEQQSGREAADDRGDADQPGDAGGGDRLPPAIDQDRHEVDHDRD